MFPRHSTPSRMTRFRLYSGTFLLALSTLALEISLARLLSVVSWYYLAFFTISTAMLGSTAGAMFVFLRPAAADGEAFARRQARATMAYAASIPAALLLLCVLPMEFHLSKARIVMYLGTMIAAAAASAAPYFFAGIAITSALTRSGAPVGRVYASDLVGASFGCLAVLAALSWCSVPTLILLCAAVALAAAALYAGRGQRALRRPLAALAVALAALVLLNATAPFGVEGIRPLIVKGRVDTDLDRLLERWNSFSRVVVGERFRGAPQYWGPSPRAPRIDSIVQHDMSIDGMAGTNVCRFRSPSDIAHLRYDVTSIAYALRPRGGACIIGVGGGRDIQCALLSGHERVVGVELNPIFIDVHERLLRGFSGIAGRRDVELVTDEGRSYLSRTGERFALIQLSLIDTWASTGAGAFSLSENSLYTIEGWQLFLRRLRADGILTVSRWHSPVEPGETGRALSLAAAALFAEGVARPDRHIALVTQGWISTLLVKRAPFTAAERDTLAARCAELGFTTLVQPGAAPEHRWLRRIMAARSIDELNGLGGGQPLDFSPPTDDRPFFFNMLRASFIPAALFHRSVVNSRQGVILGNLVAAIVLALLILALAAAAVPVLLLPLLASRRGGNAAVALPGGRRRIAAGAAYFSLIGSGFMLLEISMMQRFTLLLGHPMYSLGIILFALILATGAGAWLSERIPVDRPARLRALPAALAGYVLILMVGLPPLIRASIGAALPARAAITCLILLPLGLLLGCFFPLGMRLLRAAGLPERVTPWYWGLNGIFGVLSSAAAVAISMYAGIPVNQGIAACFYLLLIPCMAALGRGVK